MNGTEYINENISNSRMRGRIEKIKELARRENVSTDKVKLYIGTDCSWNRRSNRTAVQKRAVKIGQTNSTFRGYSIQTIFAWVE